MCTKFTSHHSILASIVAKLEHVFCYCCCCCCATAAAAFISTWSDWNPVERNKNSSSWAAFVSGVFVTWNAFFFVVYLYSCVHCTKLLVSTHFIYLSCFFSFCSFQSLLLWFVWFAWFFFSLFWSIFIYGSIEMLFVVTTRHENHFDANECCVHCIYKQKMMKWARKIKNSKSLEWLKLTPPEYSLILPNPKLNCIDVSFWNGTQNNFFVDCFGRFCCHTNPTYAKVNVDLFFLQICSFHRFVFVYCWNECN